MFNFVVFLGDVKKRYFCICAVKPLWFGFVATGLLTAFVLSTAYAKPTPNLLSLSQAIALAKQHDPWRTGNDLKQQALHAKSEAVGRLPNPTVSLSMMNLPTDSLDFNQDAMSQFKVGVSQMLPRGNSLTIKQQQLYIEAAQFSYMQQERLAKVQVIVAQQWFDAFLAQKTIKLIQQNKALFTQMVDIAQASYASAVGKVRQHDLIRAQLEVIQLDDKLLVEQQKLDVALAQLNQWLMPSATSHITIHYAISDVLPELSFKAETLFSSAHYSEQFVADKMSTHPSIQLLDSKYLAAKKSVDLVKQQHKPQWGLNVSYAYRDGAENNSSRADFFSVGVSFDVPLFNEKSIDKEIDASFSQAESIKTEQLLLVRSMLSEINKEKKQLQRLSDRQALYSQQLLTQIHQQAEASLTAYTNDDGDFSEVVRSSIAELNAQIVALDIDVQRLKTISRLNYYFVSVTANSHNRVGE